MKKKGWLLAILTGIILIQVIELIFFQWLFPKKKTALGENLIQEYYKGWFDVFKTLLINEPT